MAFWENLSAPRNGGNAKWCLIRDSNVVAKSEEKLGGNPFDPSYSQGYFKFLEDSDLIEMEFKGGGHSLGPIRDAMMTPFLKSWIEFYIQESGGWLSLKLS
ncbi:hypothetical protein V6N12_007875 [Hibiscus sabdariffa]|uniref:Uncharacterized protein n=1 Tax=Hibiscus sabdariffa TaxID=183260 RepID=A0ABR2F2Z4_9ROSI